MEFNLAAIHEAVEATAPERPCIVTGRRRLSYADVGERSRRLANGLVDRGLGAVRERGALAGHESGQDHLGIYLHNGNEYLESMLGAFKARVVPFNVNYRYVAEELAYLLADSGARALVFHSAFATTVSGIRALLPELTQLIQVRDASGNDLVDGAEWFEDVLAAASPTLDPDLAEAWSPDDLYMLYTGGTTGMPKGVLWRQADIWVAALGGRKLGTSDEWASLNELTAAAAAGGTRLMPAPPFMHGAAHWMAFNAFGGGNTVVLPRTVEHFDPRDTIDVVAEEGVNVLLIVGDAFAKPLIEELSGRRHDLSSLMVIVSGGAALSSGVKERLLELKPDLMLLDGLGSSETGQQATQLIGAGQAVTTGTFTPGPGLRILSEDLTTVLDEHDRSIGWLAQAGRVPLGYLGDPARTSATFPTVEGTRYSVPGDRARFAPDGSLELLGRDSATINSGGEKIFAEEVEAAITGHPAVLDVVVCGRPSERWGSEVVAILSVRRGVDAAELEREAERHVARYKLPKAWIFVDSVQRSPSGKADYRWARAVAVGAAEADG